MHAYFFAGFSSNIEDSDVFIFEQQLVSLRRHLRDVLRFSAAGNKEQSYEERLRNDRVRVFHGSFPSQHGRELVFFRPSKAILLCGGVVGQDGQTYHEST
jgi:hypothetical protein